MWPEEVNCHNYFLCNTKCDSVSKQEKERLKNIEETKKSENKRPDKFRHEWLNKTYWSICFVENQGFYCVVCRKHDVINPQNKAQTFVEQPSVRFKEHTLKTHMASGAYAAAVEANLLQKVSMFHKIYTEKLEVETSVFEQAFSTAYLLMKEFIAIRKFVIFIGFMQHVIGVSNFQHFQHRSRGSVREIFLTVGQTVREDLLKQARRARSFGLMIDEVTDIAVCSQLVTFIQYWDRGSGSVETAFLSAQNVLEDFESCNADAITQLVIRQ